MWTCLTDIWPETIFIDTILIEKLHTGFQGSQWQRMGLKPNKSGTPGICETSPQLAPSGTSHVKNMLLSPWKLSES